MAIQQTQNRLTMRLYTSSFDSTKWGSCRLLLPFSFVIGTHSLTRCGLQIPTLFTQTKRSSFVLVLYFTLKFISISCLHYLHSIVNACVWLWTHCQVVACLGWVQV